MEPNIQEMTPISDETLPGDDESFKWTTTYTLLVINAVIGLIIFEWAWSKTYRFRNPIKELDDMFPAYKRHDALKWKKWYFYPGALTLLVPRMILLNLLFLTLVMWINLVMIG